MSSFSRSIEASEPREGHGGFHLLAAVLPGAAVRRGHALPGLELARRLGGGGIGAETATQVLGRQAGSGQVSRGGGLHGPPPLVRTGASARAGVPRHVVALAGLELGGALEPLGQQHGLRGGAGGLGYFVLI